MALNWEKRSVRLLIAESNGRHFRLEKNQAANNTAGYTVREVTAQFRDLRVARVGKLAEAKALAEKWANGEAPSEPIRKVGGTRVRDLTLGLGTRK